DNGLTVRNFGGKLGAYVADILVNRGFGLASLLIPVVLFLWGLQVLRIRKFRLFKIFFQIVFSLLWISTLFGTFFKSGNLYVLGGNVGMHTSLYLRGLLGVVGLTLIMAFSLLCYFVVNYSLGKLKWKRKPKKAVQTEGGREEDAVPQPEERQEAVPTAERMAEEPKEDPLAGMTVTMRMGLGADTGAGEAVEVEDGVEMSVNGEVENDMEINDTTVPEEAGEEEAEPIEEEPAGEEPQENEEGDDLGEMKIVDTRTATENNNAKVEAGPEHYTIDTPYDPRLELRDYRFPGLDLLEDFGDQSQNIQDMNEELQTNKNRIVATLQNYGIDISKISATIGPTVTLYEIVPAPGVRISKIKNLEDDIALSLSALGIRIIAPIPGKGTIGIEVPNSKKQVVPMRDMLTCAKFRKAGYALPIALGKTISNEEFVTDLAKMPHLLVAGATGQGKSVGLNAIIASLLYSKHPAELKFVMVDPKKVELSLFNKIERHYLAKLPDTDEAVITDTRKVVRTLKSLCIEMDERYDLLKDAAAKNLKEYNAKFVARKLNPENGHRYLPYIVLIIDEFADLIMTAGKEVEQPIARLAQLARAIGIHLVIATQRPSVNVITGLIKANFPARIAFKVQSKVDSRTILDSNGADQLIGRGDMLISMGEGITRLQCAFIDTPEIERISDFIGEQRAFPTAYQLPDCPEEGEGGGGAADMEGEEWDSMFKDAAEMVVSSQQASTSMLQRKFKLGYNRAGRIMDQLESAGVVSPFDGRKIREVKIKDPAALQQIFAAIGLAD
ncbi:MAG: DNA translocase FtsK, partial [Bacteroidales bacterium]|nr:DNA translocase FtsK [Bacteroidales bacterium]